MKTEGILAFALLLIFTSCQSLSDRNELYISPSGNDDNPGTRAKPLKTLEGARNAIRVQKEEKVFKGCRVLLRQGIYYRNSSFVLNEEDAGTEDAPVLYSAYKGEEVIIHGGIRVAVETSHQVKDTTVLGRFDSAILGKIVEVDLNSLGIDDLGVLRPVGFSRPYGPAWPELFVNGTPYSLARWPNDSTIKMGAVIDKGSVPRDGDFSKRGGAFRFETDRPMSWKSHENIWISGYFRRGWAEDAVELAEIDTVKRIFRTKQPSLYGFGSGEKFNRYYVYNILEEVDEPGEYYFDRTTFKLYFFPKEEINSIEISNLEEPLFSIRGASNIRIEGLVFECSRGMGIYMERTLNNLVKDCIFRNLGIVGVSMGRGIVPFANLVHEETGEPSGDIIGSYLQHIYADPVFNRQSGNNNGIVNCTIYNTGAGGIHLSGGDRLSLEPANNYVENCTIHDFNRIEKSYRAGIDISGVGNRISHCEIFNAPSMAILLRGNDHLIEYNEIHHVCREVHDQGALYYGRDPSERGHKVYYNFFHNLNSIHATTAVYHDDGACGMEVFGNVFYKPGKIPVLIGGGMDNPYTNNVFIDAQLGIHVDNRNQNWASATLTEGGIYDQRLEMVRFQEPPYSEKYPNLSRYWEDDPSQPKRNPVSKNIFYRVEQPYRHNKDWMPFMDDNWITDENPGFVDEDNMDFRLKETSPAFEKIPGFEMIPFEEIGTR